MKHPKNSFDVRTSFLNFFKDKGHTAVPSSPLIPADDPTLLFANAGMNQFKDTFLGKEKRSYNRATSIQKCVRAGGKHNDLDQVGFTERHLTFFEMMGNFSFGDYFKKEAIEYAWEYLTKVMGFEEEKLYATVFEKDDESFEIWNKLIGLPKNRVVRLGEKDNFWQMGDTGPCGPCSEILIDQGADKSCGKKSCGPGCDCPRYTEIWNNVFMQYDRQEDGSLVPLEQTGVDTGMGFERLCMIAQDKNSVFDIDLFVPLRTKIEKLTGLSYDKSSKDVQASFNVLCDHVRSSSLIIADGGTPSNEGRGYVLRKIIRRAALFAQKLSDKSDLFTNLAKEFIGFFGPIYPELNESETLIRNLIQSEIDRFAASLISGQAILETYIDENKKKKLKEISGRQAFKLYDTYGFPIELTKLIVQEKGFSVDEKQFEVEMRQQQLQSGKKVETKEEEISIPDGLKTQFVGYEELETKSKVLFAKQEKDHAWVVVDKSPFYVESGGQVNDSGFVTIGDASFSIVDLKKFSSAEDAPVAVKLDTSGKSRVEIKTGQSAHCVVDDVVRWNTVRNHTATHMLQAALVAVLGKGVKQAGSLVNDKYLRFDFNFHRPMTQEEIEQVEEVVNQKILQDIKTNIYYTSLAKAKQSGVISFFGEKYDPEKVRVVEIPGFSAELCGGTHAPRTGIIGLFKITSEVALSAGVRRMVAITGPEALSLFQKQSRILKTLFEEYKANIENISDAVLKQKESLHQVTLELRKLKRELFKLQIPKWHSEIKTLGSIPFLYLELEDLTNEELRQIAQELGKSKPALYFLLSKASGSQKVMFLAQLSQHLTSALNFKDFGLFLKEKVGLKGGGSSTLLQGGGAYNPETKQCIEGWLSKKKE